MNTLRTMLRAGVIGSALAVSVPVLLSAAAGIARAATDPAYFTNTDGSLEVVYGGGGLALYATIIDAHNPEGVTETCHYRATGVMGTLSLPYDADTLVTGPHPSAPVTIVFQQLGGKYSVNVTCNGTGNSAAYSPVTY